MEDRGLRIEDGGSKIDNRRSRIRLDFSLLFSIFYPRSSILDPRSSILDPRSSILDPRSSILDPRSSIFNPQSSRSRSVHRESFLARFFFLNDLAVEEVNASICMRGVALVVSDHADGRALAVQLAKQFHYRFAV